MNTLFKRGLALVLTLALCIGLAAGVTVSAAGEAGRWVKVTDVAQLQAGDKVIIVSAGESGTYALGTNQKTNNREAVAVTVSEDVLTPVENAQVLTLESGVLEGTLAFKTETGYLYSAGGDSKNYLKTQTTLDESGSWIITIENGIATVKAQSGGTRNWLRFNPNNGTPLFATYSGGQEDIALYKLDEGDVDPVAKILNGYYVIKESVSGNEEESCSIEFFPAEAGATYGTCVVANSGNASLEGTFNYSYDAETGVVSVENSGISIKPLTMEAALNLKVSRGVYGQLVKAEPPTLVEGDNVITADPNPKKTYTFTAPKAGTYILSITEGADVAQVSGVTLPATYELAEGETFTAIFSTTDNAKHDITVNVVRDVPADPAADSQLTIPQATELGLSKDHNTYTEGKYYVTGVVTEVYNTQYGNMKITDEAGNILTIYGTYSADGETRYDAMEVKPVAGDTVKIYGIVGQFNGTAQIKNGWIVEHTAAEGETPVEPPVENNDPAADTQLTIEEAIALGLSKDHNTYTDGKYYVTGVITEVYNTQYGNMKITDEAGNILTIYGTFDADGTNRYDAMAVQPVAGDTVKIYGIVGQYNDVAQIKNGWIVEHTAAEGETPVEPPVDEEPGDEPNDEPVQPPVTGAAPTAGQYLLGMVQGNLGKTLYFAGTTANTDYYLATTENIAEATVVTVEEVEGGYRLSFLDGGVKKYIDIYQNGTYVNLRLTEEPTAVFTWNSDYKTFQTMIGETAYYMGTYNEYSTLSASKLSYIETSFPTQLYESSPNTADSNPSVMIILAVMFVSAGAVLTLGKKAVR